MGRREIIAGLIAFAGCQTFAQSDIASPRLRFDVASVRRDDAAARAGSVQFLPGGHRLIEHASEWSDPDGMETY